MLMTTLIQAIRSMVEGKEEGVEMEMGRWSGKEEREEGDVWTESVIM